MDIRKIHEVIRQLRHPQTGCPWDREQTFADLLKPLKDETVELEQALQRSDRENIAEELGDVLFNVCQLLAAAEDEGIADSAAVIDGICDKMIRRHPHVFGDEKADNPEDAAEVYRRAKEREKA